ncbi:MAG: hypothetical protein QGF59_25205 [Pirellulaceae bacterium]|nr:hypothetical protein [Pirellulaceae bacterium]
MKSAELAPDLGKLLKKDNPHFRTWAIARLAEIASPASDKVLLAAYDDSGLLQQWQFVPSLVARGDAIVPLVQRRLQAAKPEIPWNLLGLLEDIHTARSARVLEGAPNYVSYYWPVGLFGRKDQTWSGCHIGTCIAALARIGDELALLEFRRMLRDRDYFLNHKEIAEAAAELKWRELVPDIIDRLVQEYEGNVKQFGVDHEASSPSLRKLTGQSFPEDPRAWRAWLEL